MAKQRLTRGEKNIAWVEQYCRVPEGMLSGQPFRLRDWQRKIFLEIYDTPTRNAYISFGRKNGKTGLASTLTLLHTVGPEAEPNSKLYSAAQSREQASILYRHAATMVRMNPDLAGVQMHDTSKILTCQELGTVYRALSGEEKTAYGLSPKVSIHDELGQVQGPTYPLFDAMETAAGAYANPLTIVISTQAPTDAALFSTLIDDALRGGDPLDKVFLYTAPMDADPFSEEAIRAANPAFGDFLNPATVWAQARKAQRLPAFEAAYRNLVLNQRVTAHAPFVTKSIWDANGGEVASSFEGYPVYCGLDLSETSDLTAFVTMAFIQGQWHVKPVFWLPAEGLVERAREDRVPYDVWAREGHLQTTPGRAIEFSYIARLMVDVFARNDVRAVGFDRHLMKHLKPWLTHAGLSEAQLERFIDFGQGFLGMAPAVRELEAQLLNANFCHGGHPVLNMCAANAVAINDPAGNRKLDKSKSTGRIDGMVALAMATGVGITQNLPAAVSIWDRPEMWPELA